MCANFNKYSDTYKSEIDKSIRFSGQTVEFFTAVKAELILKLARTFGSNINKLNVLDLGCGIGQTDTFLNNKFSMLSGVDVAHEAVDKARILNPTVDYKVYDGGKLPFKDNTFDIVFTICVMHHLQVTQRNYFISEMRRVSKYGGLIMIFEHNPLNYFTRHAVKKCEFDKDAVLIGKVELKTLLHDNDLFIIDENYIIFFPFRGKLFRYIERGLGKLPLGSQYYLVAKKSSDIL